MSSGERSFLDPIKECVKYARKFECRIRKRKQERSWRREVQRQLRDPDNYDFWA